MNLRFGAWLVVGSVVAAAPACGSPGSGGTSTSRAVAPPAGSGAGDDATPGVAGPGGASAGAAPDAGSPAAGAPTVSRTEGAPESAGRAPAAPNDPQALQDARKRALKSGFHDVHEALLSYYAENSHYPKDRKELETDPALAAAVAELEKTGTGVSYTSDGGSFTLTVKRADGPPLTLSGNNQKFRRTPPPTAETTAGT